MGLLALLVFAIVVILLMVGATWGYNAALRRMVGEKHRAVQMIFESGEVPPAWRKPFENKLDRLSRAPGKADRLRDAQRQAAVAYVKKLDGLIGYVRRSTLVDGDDARELLLSKLERARIDWQR